MENQEVQEVWDFWKFQDEMMIDFTLFEEQIFAQSTLDDHAQELKEDIIGSLDHGLTAQLKPSIPHPLPHVEEKVDKDDQQRTLIKENETFFSSDSMDPCLQSFLFEMHVSDDHVERTDVAYVATSETSSNPKKRRIKGQKDSSEGIKLRAIAKEQQKMRNRVTATRSYAKKQKYVKDLEVQCGELHKENTLRNKVLKFLEISMEVGTCPRKLVRTTSGPIPSYSPLL